MMSDKMREEFEVWANGDVDLDISKMSDGGYYRNIQTIIAWDAWKSSRAARCSNACAGMTDPAAEIAELKRQRDSLICVVQKYECAFDGLFGHCGSNGVFNHWGRPIDCTALNEAHELSRKAIKGSAS